MVIVVGLDGYNYNHYKRTPLPGSHSPSTDGLNVHIALSGPAMLTFEEWDPMVAAVAEAKAVLTELGKDQNAADSH